MGDLNFKKSGYAINEDGVSGLALVQIDVDGDKYHGLINRKYQEVSPCIYTHIYPFYYGDAIVLLNGKYGIIDTEGSLKKHLPYEWRHSFEDEDEVTKAGTEDYECCINRHGVEIYKRYESIDYWDEDDYNLAKVVQNGKIGFIDKDFDEVIECQFDEARGFCDELARVEKNDKCGYINQYGETVIPFEYDDYGYEGFYKGIAKVSKNGKYGFIDKNNNIIVPLKYTEISRFGEDSYKGLPSGVALAERNGGEVLVNEKGEEISKLYNEIRSFYDKNYVVVVNHDRNVTFGAIGKDGKEILACVYTSSRELELRLE